MKKIIALLLALVLALGLVACGGSTTTTTTTTPPDVLVNEPETPETPDAPETPAEEEPTEWEGDYETATFEDIRKYGYGSTKWDGSLPLTTAGDKIEIGIKVNNYVTDFETNPLTLYLEEKTGVDLSFRT